MPWSNPFNLTYTNLKSTRVLIVDDDQTDRMILRRCAELAGFQLIEEAADGAEAMQKLTKFRTDLVYLDMQLPKMSGLEICQEIFNARMQNDIVVIMQTSSDHFQSRIEAFKLGVTDYIMKPIDAQEVVSRTMAHIERKAYKQQLKQENNRMNQEIREAGRMQRILLPSDRELNEIREEQKLDISYLYHPCSDLAGDYLAIHKISDDETLMLNVDVTGHGVSASLYTFAIHTLLKELAKPGVDPAELLQTANQRLFSVMDVDKFATIFLGIIRQSDQSLRFSAAASPPPILLHNHQASLLKSDGLMLGVKEDQIYETSHVSFESGDRLLVYSDALLETAMLDEAFLSEQQIMDYLSTHKAANSNDMLQQLSLQFFAERLYYLRDDLTMIACTQQ